MILKLHDRVGGKVARLEMSVSIFVLSRITPGKCAQYVEGREE
jgi:hypothetical protein